MNLIVAVDLNWAIGCNGSLLKRIPEDMKFFKKMTTGNVIVMGRKTLETFPGGKPLKDRVNIVLTRNEHYICEGSVVCCGMDKLNEILKNYDTKDIFIIGGGTVYNQFIERCDTAYVTKINKSFEADTFIKNLDKNENWIVAEESELNIVDDIEYKFVKYTRK